MAHDEDCRKTREIQILTREVADLKADAERDFIAHVQIVEALKSRAADALARAERAEKEAEGFAADAATQHDLLAASEARSKALEQAAFALLEETGGDYRAPSIGALDRLSRALLSPPPPSETTPNGEVTP